MTTPNEADDFWGMFDLDEFPAFATAEELVAHSIQSHRHHFQHDDVRTLHSSGHLRLAGPGISEHKASLAKVAELAGSFQKLVTALGSSLSGAKTTISARAEQYTELLLDASPAPGSLILSFEPAVSPSAELRPRDEMINGNPDQLIDKVFGALGALLGAQGSIEESDEIAELLREYGSKTSTSLRQFAAAAADANFDLDLVWRQPQRRTLEMHVPVSTSKAITRLVQGRRLDEEPIELIGLLKTVSLSGHWVMTDKEFGTVAFDCANIGGEPHRAFNPGALVRVEATMRTTEAPGRAATRTFSAKAITATEPASADTDEAADAR